MQANSEETLDIGKKLVELGFAKASVPQDIKKNTIESQLAPALLSAEAYAKSYRNGIWSDCLPPLPIYVVYWRKGTQLTGQLMVLTAKKILHLLALASRGALLSVKYIALWPFRGSRKQVQAT